VSAGSTPYTVNAAGNIVIRGGDSFTYDQANRLATAQVAGTTMSYTYDGDGKLARTMGTVNTYTYDIGGGLPVVISDGSRTYVWGAQGLAYTVDGAGTVSVSHSDGLGSVRAVTNATGSVIQTYQTDAFGVSQAAGTLGSTTQPFQFTGEQRDPTGLIYLRARFYDPAIGRFLSRDPFSARRAYAACHRIERVSTT